jgi:hypothetical protein
MYAAMAVGVLLAAETPRRENYAKTVAAVIITLLLYWLAHSYADLAGERVRSGARLTARGLLATMLRELPILIGAAIPLATLCSLDRWNRPVRRCPLGGVDLGRDRPVHRAWGPATTSPAAARRRPRHRRPRHRKRRGPLTARPAVTRRAYRPVL